MLFTISNDYAVLDIGYNDLRYGVLYAQQIPWLVKQKHRVKIEQFLPLNFTLCRRSFHQRLLCHQVPSHEHRDAREYNLWQENDG